MCALNYVVQRLFCAFPALSVNMWKSKHNYAYLIGRSLAGCRAGFHRYSARRRNGA
jgi:hypothetical protein